jgi:hypothetical protein
MNKFLLTLLILLPLASHAFHPGETKGAFYFLGKYVS